MPNLSDRLQQLKTEKKLLQKDIARAINVSLRSYQRYESGERCPDTDILIRLANYFDVSTDYLLGRSNSKVFENIEVSKDKNDILTFLENISHDENTINNKESLTLEDIASINKLLKFVIASVEKE